MKRIAAVVVSLAGLLLVAGCQSDTPSPQQEKDMRSGLQDTSPDLSKMRPQDRAMMEKFMQKPSGGPPAPPPASAAPAAKP